MLMGPLRPGFASQDPVAIRTAGRYINLGDWITHFTYAKFEGTELKLMKRNGDGPPGNDVVITGAPAGKP